MSPGVETDSGNLNFARTSTGDYDKLCSLDVLGLDNEQGGEQHNIYETFTNQLERSPKGWYQTGLLWKPDIPILPNNKTGSLARLRNLVKRLERSPELLNECKNIIKEQEEEGIIEKAPEEALG